MDKIYLDHNATTPVAPEVLDIVTSVLRDQFGNPSSVHSIGRSARVLIDEAREQVASLIGASPSEIVFTSGGTEANNFALLGVALGQGKTGGHIITSHVEHPSILNPCRQLESLGFVVDRLQVDKLGRIDFEELDSCLTDSTLLVSLQHANSETGVLQDIARAGEIVRKKGVLFHTDAVQSVGKIPLQVQDLPVDMLSISAHKLNGPKGIGALYLRKGSPDLFSPVCGGGQEKKRRGGTENVAGIAGFGKACELARLSKFSNLAALRDHFLKQVSDQISGVEVFGDLENRLPNTLNLGFEGVEGDTLLIALDMAGVAVSTGSACSSGSGLPSPVLTAMGIATDKINSSIRFSLGWSNTKADIEHAANILVEAVSVNRAGSLVEKTIKT